MGGFLCKFRKRRIPIIDQDEEDITTDLIIDEDYSYVEYNPELEFHLIIGPHFVPFNEECAICLIEYSVGQKVKIMGCNHFFHAKCYTKWKKESKLGLCVFCMKEMGSEEKWTMEID